MAQNRCLNLCIDAWTTCKNTDNSNCDISRSTCDMRCRLDGEAPTPPLAPNVPWGYLVFDTATGHWGAAWGYSAGNQARAAATRECFNSGGRSCDWKIPARGGCVAVAEGDGASGRRGHDKSGGQGARAVASDKAVENCRTAGGRNCKVVASVCSFGR